MALGWYTVANATSYNIYVSTSSGAGERGNKYTASGEPAVVPSLTNNTTYYFVVTAANAGGQGPASSQVSATTSSATPSKGKTIPVPCAASGAPTSYNDPLYAAQWHIMRSVVPPYVFNDSTAPPASGSDVNQQVSTQTGCGVKVAVVDTGLEIGHEDLKDNVVPNGSYNFNTNGTDPTNPDPTGDHGTSVAGLIGARANNGKGGRGVAGEASLVGYNFLATSTTAEFQIPALGGAIGSYASDVAVFNQSYGAIGLVLDSTVEAQYLYGVTNFRVVSGIAKGAIYVKAAGNGFGAGDETGKLNCALAIPAGVSCEDANMDGDNTTPYNIVVGALNAGYGTTPQTKSSYSTAGSALWISAPGGEFGVSNATLHNAGYTCVDLYGNPVTCTHPLIDAAMITTDQSGCIAGYAVTGFNGATTINDFNLGGTTTQATHNPNCNYTSTFNGTSSATPVTSGAIAVLLQANSGLTWRDVKYILAATADQVDLGRTITLPASCGSFTSTTWSTHSTTNNAAATVHFHPWYGFGKINLDKAVAMAAPASWTANGFGTTTVSSTWTDTCYLPSALVPPCNPLTSTTLATTLASGTNHTIPDCNATGISMASIATSTGITFIEAVQVNVCVTHPNIGELQFNLTNVTTSEVAVVLPGQNGFDGTPFTGGPTGKCQLFLVNQFYGESAASGFTLTAYDTVSGNTGTLDGWQIRVWGH